MKEGIREWREVGKGGERGEREGGGEREWREGWGNWSEWLMGEGCGVCVGGGGGKSWLEGVQRTGQKKLWFLATMHRTTFGGTCCTTLCHSGGRRSGTNSVPAGPCLSPDDRAIPRVGKQRGIRECSQIITLGLETGVRRHDRRLRGIVTAS